MRTTIDINDALLKALRKEAAEKGKPFKTVVEETLQRGLSTGVTKKRPKIRIVPAAVGVKAPYRAISMNQLFDDIEMADPAPRP